MKVKIVSSVLILIINLLIINCKFYEQTTSWQLSGTASFRGTVSNNVKLAVFFSSERWHYWGSNNSKLASNVINLGSIAGVATPFTLNINAPEVSPEMECAQLYLVMWDDAGNDSIYDYSSPEHFAHSQTGDPVFKTEEEDYLTWDTHGGHWYFEPAINLNNGARTGWNQRVGQSYVPIDDALKTGAKLVSSRDF